MATKILENRLSELLKHAGYVNGFLEEITRSAGHIGVVLVDGNFRQRFCGKYGLKKEELACLIKLSEMYGFLRFNYRTKKIHLLRWT